MLKIDIRKQTKTKTFYVPIYYESANTINQTRYFNSRSFGFVKNIQVIPITTFDFLEGRLQDGIEKLMTQLLNNPKDDNFDDDTIFLITDLKTQIIGSKNILSGQFCYLGIK